MGMLKQKLGAALVLALDLNKAASEILAAYILYWTENKK